MSKQGNVTKDDIAARLSTRRGCSKKTAKSFIDDFLAILTEGLIDGERVVFRGFGAFEVKEVSARMGVHPVTKERKLVSAYKMPKFSAGDGLVTAIRSKE